MDTDVGLLHEEAASPHVADDNLLHEVSTHPVANPAVTTLHLLSDLAGCRWSILHVHR